VSQEDMISTIVREVLAELNGNGGGNGHAVKVAPPPAKTGIDAARDYPLATKRPDLVKTSTGKTLDQITLDAVVKGDVKADEVRITPEVLEMQAQVAEQSGRPQLAMNMRRAAELTRVSDERILEIYNALRPYRSTKAELLAIADELENEYGAKICGAFVREAADVYERRGRLNT
jgi:propanediol dehydratase small subunit